METYFLFVVKVACSLSVFYLFGLILFRNDTKFKLHRLYLLSSIAVSLALPLNKVSLSLPHNEKQAVYTAKQPVHNGIKIEPASNSASKAIAQLPYRAIIPSSSPSINYLSIIYLIYWIIAGIILFRILYSLANLVLGYIRSDRKRLGIYTIVHHPFRTASYSFFRWIFISKNVMDAKEKQNIINHELVHARQFHSIDVIMVELLSAVMWFNPFIWLMRRWMQQLHEYLADEGVLNSGTNVLEYQVLLVNQVAGDRLISLPSGFTQSLIKKRLTMMTKTKINKKSGYRLLTLVPLTGLIFVAFSFTNKADATKSTKSKSVSFINQGMVSDTTRNSKQMQKSPRIVIDTVKMEGRKYDMEAVPPPPPAPTNVKTPLPESAKVVTAVAPTKMNVFYLGVDNPVNIAVSGEPADNIFPTISNGSIHRVGNSYVVNPKQLGMAKIDIFAEMDGRRLHMGEMEFRVKSIPDPVASIKTLEGYKTNGLITKKELLDANGIDVMLSNFDFDLNFKVTSFVLSYTLPNEFKIVEEVSKSDKFTERQINEIKSLLKWQKVTFEAITVVGPDGRQRKLNPMVFTIED